MKAAVYKSYGPPEVLHIEEVPTPTLGDEHADRVLVRVHYSSINPIDYIHRSGFIGVRPTAGLTKPKPADQIVGTDVAGEVVAVGKSVTRFKVGDKVFGSGWGCHAEYLRARENSLALIPKTLSFKEAAAIPLAAQTALQGLRDVAKIQAGHKVLINGASGGIGHMAVQVAKYFGAEVTAVCSSANQAWVKALGADYMVDYSKEDFTKNGKRYNIIYDSVGKRAYLSCKPSLAPNGIYISENPVKARFQLLQLVWSRLTRDQQHGMHLTQASAQDLELLRELADTGRLKPMIEKTYSLDQIAEAHRHGERGEIGDRQHA